jgi:hypothetical protein
MEDAIMKRLVLILLVLVLFLPTNLSFVHAADPIKVKVDGYQLSFDVPPTIISGRVLVPLRAIFEALGTDVAWNNNTKTVTATKDSTKITLTVNNKTAKVNAKSIALDVPLKLINSRVLVPTRFVAESLGASVDWDSETRTVSIKSVGTHPVGGTYLPAPSYASIVKTEEYQEILKAYALEDISWHEDPQTQIDWMENFFIAYMVGDWEFDTADTIIDADWVCSGFDEGSITQWADKHNDYIGVFINNYYGNLYFKDGKFYYNTSGATPNITEEELSSYVKKNYEAILKIYNDFHVAGLTNENSKQLERRCGQNPGL